MNQLPPRDRELIEAIAENWCPPEQTEAQSMRFQRELRQELTGRERPKTMAGVSWALALATVALVMGFSAITQWTTPTEDIRALTTSAGESEETIVDVWASNEAGLDDDSLPDDYIILSQLID